MKELLDATEAALSSVPRAQEMNAVLDKTYPYTVWALAADRPDSYTLDSRHGLRFYRITTQSFGKTLTSALDNDTRVTDALLDQSLDATGYDCGPCRIQVGSAVVRDPDNAGVVGVTTTLLFTAIKEA